jgi:hypothetical protein
VLHTGTVIDVDPNAVLIARIDAGRIRAFDVANTTVGAAVSTTAA